MDLKWSTESLFHNTLSAFLTFTVIGICDLIRLEAASGSIESVKKGEI